jgi:hypothetical protein
MPRKRLISAVVIIAVVIGAVVIWRLTHPPISDQEQINRLIDRVEQGVERKKPSEILATIADDYRDSTGFTKRDIHQLSLSLLRVDGRPQVTLTDVRIEIHGNEADVSLEGDVRIAFAGAESQEFNGALSVHLSKRSGKWLIVSTSGWQGEVGGGFEE